MATDYETSLKLGWDTLRLIQENQTASIIRWTNSTRDPVLGTPGTSTQVTGLADLPVVVEDVTEDTLRWSTGELDYKDRVFVFYDVEIFTTDQIEWAGARYDIFGIQKVPGTGKSRVAGKRVTGPLTGPV